MPPVPQPLEDYALIGDTHTGALVGRDGSIDWWCVPRFDSAACFAALLGDRDNGRWLLAPVDGGRATRRRYVPDTLVLESEWDVAGGSVRITDLQPVRDGTSRLVRIVEGLAGEVVIEVELVIRFDYGHVVPWVRRDHDGRLRVLAGPDGLCLDTPVPLRGRDLRTRGRFTVRAGQRVPFVLSWYPSHEVPPSPGHPDEEVASAVAWWQGWAARARPLAAAPPGRASRWSDAVHRSLLTLKALTYAPTGGIVAALTTSLPEALGGVRNWDYRYCWTRDATFTLYALLQSGYVDEARAWRDWLLRAVAGTPRQLQILYGAGGERRLTEVELGWLAGYEGSRPVRVGNAAVNQFQLDVFGEVMDTLSVARRVGMEESDDAWRLQVALLEELEGVWDQPDEGIWEVRGPRRHFVHSKVMAWVAADRAAAAVEAGRDGPADRWRRLAADIHAEVCDRGFDAGRGSFVQSYGSDALDASLLMLPLVGFLPVGDGRVAGTVRAIERELVVDGLVLRYAGEGSAEVDGLPAGEGAFLPCSFWLADVWAMSGRRAEAADLFDRLLDLRTDLGLLAEEYDGARRRLVGNFPQAFSHLALVNTARNLTEAASGAGHHRSRRDGPARR